MILELECIIFNKIHIFAKLNVIVRSSSSTTHIYVVTHTHTEIYNLFVNIWVNVCKIQEDSENKTLNHLGMLLNHMIGSGMAMKKRTS